MAVLAIAAAGAAAGSLIGVGWATGWIAGSLIGTLLFPQRGPTQQGPRLGDLTVTSSAYGAPIAIGYGTLRMAGNLIWSSGIREHKNVHDAGLGKGLGGGSRSTVTYSYSASFAVAFAEGPAEDVLRIWADGKLIFDKRGTSDTTAKNGLQLRFYPGDEQQLPDSLIEAYVGEGNAPAHRGLCYLVFEDLPLADYGNRIPNITAEIAFAATHQTPVKTVRWTGNATGWQSGSLLPDLERGYAYLERTGGGVNGLGRIDLRTMVEDRQQSVEIEGSRPHLVGLTRSGYLVATVGSTNSQPIHLIDPSTFQPIASWGMAGPGLGMTSTRFEGLSRAVPLAVYDLYGLQEFILCQGTVSTDIGLLRLTPQRTLEFLYASGPGAGSRPLGIISGETREGSATAWYLSGPNYGAGASAAPVYLSKLTVAANARWDEGLGQTFGVERTAVATWAPGDLIPGATVLSGVGDVLWDATDQSLILFASAPGQTYAIKADPETGALRWRTSVPFAFGSGQGAAYSRLADGVLGWMSGNRAVA
ncbi:MAG: hypothetical protein IRY94_07885, partial [Rhodospirillaceae bacterium]|nr:hypothetical protein [Rhodospirillaceae bacterium]